MINKAFASEQSYKEMAAKYTKADTLLAIGLYVFIIALYLGMGMIQAKTGLYLGIPVNILTVVVCIIIIAVRKQKFGTIGITSRNLNKSLLLGLAVGICISLVICVPALLSGAKFKSDGFLYSVLYFLLIGLQEEILFRGYIQTRLYGVMKSDTLAVIIGGVMFALTHIPYQMYNMGTGNFIEFIASNYVWITITFTGHFIFNFLYRKYNSLAAPTASHWLMNLGSDLFL